MRLSLAMLYLLHFSMLSSGICAPYSEVIYELPSYFGFDADEAAFSVSSTTFSFILVASSSSHISLIPR